MIEVWLISMYGILCYGIGIYLGRKWEQAKGTKRDSNDWVRWE